MVSDSALKDCIIVGGGPAGLTAGIYLKRFRRNILLIDNYQSRAELIPRSHNYPGFVNGISGKQLLENLRLQFQGFEGSIIRDEVIKIEKSNNEFSVASKNATYKSKNIILATGVIDIEPQLSNVKHGIKEGLIRHCAVCDAYEVINQKIAVVGIASKVLQEIDFLLDYSSDITLLTLGNLFLTPQDLIQLEKKNVKVVSDEIIKADFSKDSTVILESSKNKYQFDTIYSALGAKVNSSFSQSLGAKHTQDDCICVNKHQQTSISGLYAIGDVVEGLNQICVATAQGAIAATEIHNSLT
jgi:thioredoxin reductase (NADPH)